MPWYVYTREGAQASLEPVFNRETGSMIYYPTTTVPDGWLRCDGSVVSQATYPDLYAVVQNFYNIGGEGIGNFRLPDARDKFLRGVGGATGFAVTDGDITHTHTLTHSAHPVSAAHTHTIPAHVHAVVHHTHDATHDHGPGDLAATGAVTGGVTADSTGLGTNAAILAHTHNIDSRSDSVALTTTTTTDASVSSAGPWTSDAQNLALTLAASAGHVSGSATSLPPFMALYVIIKT